MGDNVIDRYTAFETDSLQEIMNQQLKPAVRNVTESTKVTRGATTWAALLISAILLTCGGGWLYGQKAPAKISWSSPILVEWVQPNQQRTVSVTFRSNQTISDTELRVVPALASVVSVTPLSFRRINANENVSVMLTLRGPSAAGAKLEGTVQLRAKGGKNTLAKPLSVTVLVHEQPWNTTVIGPSAVSVSYPEGWHVSYPIRDDPNYVDIAPQDDGLAGGGVSITFDPLTAAAFAAERDPELLLLDEFTSDFNGIRWTQWLLAEPDSRLRYRTAFRPFETGVMVVSAVDPAVDQNTFEFIVASLSK
jgi:hypothetical protein